MNFRVDNANVSLLQEPMVLNPEFIVADEPVAALDVSIQAQIINLFSEPTGEKGIILFVHFT